MARVKFIIAVHVVVVIVVAVMHTSFPYCLKLLPIQQYLYYEAIECVSENDLTEEDYKSFGTQYDKQIAIFGKDLLIGENCQYAIFNC